MIAGVTKETFPGERRVALVPDSLAALAKASVEVVVESGAGEAAGYPDEAYTQRGVEMAARADVFDRADTLLHVRTHGADPGSASDLSSLRDSQVVIGFAEPLEAHGRLKAVADTGASLLAMELMPRITRAQSMDALSSMATITGYQAVLTAATRLPRMFPLLMTAAGTLAPARVLVIGAGVAGLQAIATARRLGARVSAYDVRPAVKEQIESLGADFVELDLDAGDAEDAGGYARAQDEEFYERQRQELGKVVAASDVAITTAAIPGKASPLLITTQAVEAMRPGSVIIDLASERGGNCEVTRAGETVSHAGTSVIGPLNLPSTIPYHASQMYSHNITTFLLHLLDEEGALRVDAEDEITGSTLVAHGGEIVHPAVLEAMGAVSSLGS